MSFEALRGSLTSSSSFEPVQGIVCRPGTSLVAVFVCAVTLTLDRTGWCDSRRRGPERYNRANWQILHGGALKYAILSAMGKDHILTC